MRRRTDCTDSFRRPNLTPSGSAHDLSELLRARLDSAAGKVPTRKVPDLVIRLAGLFDRDLGSVTPGLGRKHDYTAGKAQRMLGWTPRPLEDTILDCANSLMAVGAV